MLLPSPEKSTDASKPDSVTDVVTRFEIVMGSARITVLLRGEPVTPSASVVTTLIFSVSPGSSGLERPATLAVNTPVLQR